MNSDQSKYRVYKHTFPNGKVYIGMTKHTISDRIQLGYQHNKYMLAAIAEFGWKSVKSETLISDLSSADAELAEIKYIAEYQADNPLFGYNISAGGKATYAGLSHTEEYKHYMSEINSGKVFTEMHRKNLSNSHKGLMVGDQNPMYGKPKSELTIQRQYDSHRKEMTPVVQKDLDGNLIDTYFSLHEATRKTGVNRNCIKACLIGKQKSSKGFLWEYANTNDN